MNKFFDIAAPIATGTVATALFIAGLQWLIALPTQTPEQQAGQSSVKLSREKSHGSGVIVGPNLILTNQHVAESFGKDGFKVSLPGGKTTIGHVIANGVGVDLALVEADTGSLPAAKIDCSMPVIGTEVYAYGNPLILDRAVTWGRISGAPIEARDDDTAKLKGLVPMDLTINPGNSGGGVWKTRHGSPELVGISNAVLLANLGNPFGDGSLSGLSLMIPAPVVCHFLGRV